jgi:hypothetical protein
LRAREGIEACLMARPAGHPDNTLIAQLAAAEKWANTTDRTAATAAARAACDARFLDQARGDPVRAAHLRKAYFLRLALRSAQVRRARKQSKVQT